MESVQNNVRRLVWSGGFPVRVSELGRSRKQKKIAQEPRTAPCIEADGYYEGRCAMEWKWGKSRFSVIRRRPYQYNRAREVRTARMVLLTCVTTES